MTISDRKALVFFLSLGLLAFASLPVDRISFRLCLFENITSRPCPFCGITRSVWYGLRGEPGRSFGFHPFGWLAGASLPFVCLLLAAPRGFSGGTGKRLKPAAVAFVSSFAVFGIVRILLS